MAAFISFSSQEAPLVSPPALGATPASAAARPERTPPPAAVTRSRSALPKTKSKVSREYPKIHWIRLVIAVLVLLILLGAGIWSSANKVEPWNTLLPDYFKLLFGVVLGLIGSDVLDPRP
jgi:hypothetical protein